MHVKKKYLTILFLILATYFWFFFIHKTPQVTPKQVLGVNTNLSLYIEPESGRKPILDAINSAQKEILVEVYLLSDKEIISGLENAKSRGVGVNVMLEEHPFGGGTLNPKTKDELSSHGISVAWTNPKFSLTHEKAIVIDDNTAFILSQNITASSFTKNREFDVIDKDQSDVNEIRNIFLSDWRRETFIPGDTDLIVSPDNSRVALENLINSSKSEIDIEVENIDDSEIINLFKEKSNSLKVNLILPTLAQISSNEKAIKELKTANVNVKTLSNPYVHGKTIITDNSKAYVGSINFSTQSLDENRELGIILTDPDAIQMLNQTFTKDWNSGLEVQ